MPRPPSFAAVAAVLLAFATGSAVLWAAADRDRFPQLEPETWVRWDSKHYLAIATHGYELTPCANVDSSYAPTAWCGNTGWLPGYPALIAGLGHLGIAAPAAGVLLAALFHLITLALAWNAADDVPLIQRAGVLLLVALAPGQAYHHAVFPISMFCALALGAWIAAQRGRFVWSGALGGAAAFTYSTGFLLAAVLAAGIALGTRGEGARPRARAAGLAAALTALGFVAALAVQAVAVGRWNAFFLVQEKYGHGLHSPLGALSRTLEPLGAYPRDWVAVQSLVVTASALALVAALAWRFRPRGLDVFLTAYGLTYWVFPLVVGGNISLYRAEALLLPAFLLLRRAPVALQLVLCAGLAYLDYKMGIRFFRGVLV